MNITLVTQDFYPMVGGIASYLSGIQRKYFSQTNFSVIVPEEIGDQADYSHLPYPVYKKRFFPFLLNE